MSRQSSSLSRRTFPRTTAPGAATVALMANGELGAAAVPTRPSVLVRSLHKTRRITGSFRNIRKSSYRVENQLAEREVIT